MSELTPGERRVGNLAAQCHTNASISARLHVSVKAVEWHLTNLYAKTQMTRSDLRGLFGVDYCHHCGRA